MNNEIKIYYASKEEPMIPQFFVYFSVGLVSPTTSPKHTVTRATAPVGLHYQRAQAAVFAEQISSYDPFQRPRDSGACGSNSALGTVQLVLRTIAPPFTDDLDGQPVNGSDVVMDWEWHEDGMDAFRIAR